MASALAEAVKVVGADLVPSRRQVLAALLFSPEHSATAGQLKALLGLKSVVQVNSAIGYFGRRVQEVWGRHPEGFAANEYSWWQVVATGQPEKEQGFIWRLRAEVVTGLVACGFSASGDALPNEVRDSEVFFEGSVRQVLVNAYERNPVARVRCIEAHGCKCAVCGFDFGSAYGAGAEGFIHVHHIRTLASIGERYEVNPIEDLVPICPNCHAVVHLKNPPYSVDEIKAILRVRP